MIDDKHVLRILYEWQFCGRLTGEPDPRPSYLNAVPDYIIAAEIKARVEDVSACMNLLATKGFIKCEGRGDNGGEWTLPDGRALRVTLNDSEHSRFGEVHRVSVYVRHVEGSWRPIAMYARCGELCGLRYALTREGIVAIEAETPATEQLGGAADRRDKPPADTPNAKGYIKTPSDPSAYMAASDALLKHTPADMNITFKELPGILQDFAANRVRWTRPPGRDGGPRWNRRSVHLNDWLGYVERRKSAAALADDSWPTTSENERAERKAAIRCQKARGKQKPTSELLPELDNSRP